MKKHLLIYCLLIGAIAQGQMAVTDLGANATLTSQLTTASSTLATIERNYQVIRESADKLEKINSAISSIDKIGQVIEMQKEAFSNLDIYMTEVKNLNGKVNTKAVTGIVSKLSSVLKDVNKVLTSNFFNMTDKERLDYFQDRKNEVTSELLKTRMLKILTRK